MDAPKGVIVSDTTPLINLAGVGLLDLLPHLYGTIWIAQAVHREYSAGASPADPRLTALGWLRVASDLPLDTSLPPGLGAGEAATISLATRLDAQAVLLDEQQARRVARQRELPVVGTMGILLAAKQTGRLLSVKPVIDAMIAQGRHISPALRAGVLIAAGETD